MTTKVRGSKGFDALFSRVFDEPALKGAVGNLHDDFAAAEPTPAPVPTPAPAPVVSPAPVPVPAPVAVPAPAPVVAPVPVVEPAAAPAPVAVVPAAEPVVEVAPVSEPTPVAVVVPEAVVAPVVGAAPEVAPAPVVEAPPVVVVAAPVIAEKTPELPKITLPEVKQRDPLPAPVAKPAAPAPAKPTVGWSVELFEELMGEALTEKEPEVAVVPPVVEKPTKTRFEEIAPSRVELRAPVVVDDRPRFDERPRTEERPRPVAGSLQAGVQLPRISKPAEGSFSTLGATPSVMPPPVTRKETVAEVVAAPPIIEPAPLRQNDDITELIHQEDEFQEKDQATQSQWLPLSKNQGRILEYLYEVADGLANAEAISNELDIKIPAVRQSVLTLVNEGYLYLQGKRRVHGYATPGFTYTLNTYLCSTYMAKVKGEARLSKLRSGGSAEPPEIRVPASSSPFHIDQVELPVTDAVLSGAIGAYWEDEGLGEQQAQKWCSLFNVAPKQMREQLEWARFDLEINKQRETLTKDLISWFYDHLRTSSGLFPRPENYRSADELRAEAIRQQRESGQLAKAKNAENEFANSLQSVLSDPHSPIYQELLKRVNSFVLEQIKTSEDSAEKIELEASFKLCWSMTNSDPISSSFTFDLNTLAAAPVSSPDSVAIDGNKLIPLVAGWNLVGYNGASPQSIRQAIEPISTLVESVWSWNNGRWHSFGPTRSVNSLNKLEPGVGYWINMKQAAVWQLL